MVQITCNAYYFILGLREDGTLVSWPPDTSLPELIPPKGLDDIVSIASSPYHSVALKQDGTLVAWGRSSEGELDIPPGLSNVVAVTSPHSYSYALKDDGSIAVWGQASLTEIPPINLRKVFAINGTMALTDESPPYLPRVSIAVSRINVVMEVVPGYKYQLETSSNLINFTAVGAPFIADKSTVTQEFSVTEVGQYFRMQEVP